MPANYRRRYLSERQIREIGQIYAYLHQRHCEAFRELRKPDSSIYRARQADRTFRSIANEINAKLKLLATSLSSAQAGRSRVIFVVTEPCSVHYSIPPPEQPLIENGILASRPAHLPAEVIPSSKPCPIPIPEPEPEAEAETEIPAPGPAYFVVLDRVTDFAVRRGYRWGRRHKHSSGLTFTGLNRLIAALTKESCFLRQTLAPPPTPAEFRTIPSACSVCQEEAKISNDAERAKCTTSDARELNSPEENGEDHE